MENVMIETLFIHKCLHVAFLLVTIVCPGSMRHHHMHMQAVSISWWT